MLGEPCGLLTDCKLQCIPVEAVRTLDLAINTRDLSVYLEYLVLCCWRRTVWRVPYLCEGRGLCETRSMRWETARLPLSSTIWTSFKVFGPSWACGPVEAWLRLVAQFEISRLLSKMPGDPRLPKISAKEGDSGCPLVRYLSLSTTNSLSHPMFGNETKDCTPAAALPSPPPQVCQPCGSRWHGWMSLIILTWWIHGYLMRNLMRGRKVQDPISGVEIAVLVTKKAKLRSPKMAKCNPVQKKGHFCCASFPVFPKKNFDTSLLPPSLPPPHQKTNLTWTAT